MARLVIWSQQEAQNILQKRIADAFEARRIFENAWTECERAVFNTRGHTSERMHEIVGPDGIVSSSGVMESTDTDVGVNYAFKNVRFLHAQLSANPPSIAVRPLTSDAQDRRKAEAAEVLKQHFLRQYKLQETQDQISLSTLVYGIGIGKVFYDPDLGEIMAVDDEGVVTMEGDFCVKSCKVWDVAIDPDASRWEDVRYVVERMYIPYEEACFYWPEALELIKSARRTSTDEDSESALNLPKTDVVEVFEYWEKGSGPNGMLGRYALCLKSGQLLEPVKPNPHRFSPPATSGKIGDKKATPRPPVAHLPYVIFTDVDVPDRIYGTSALAFALELQKVMNNLDASALDNVYAHSVARLLLPDGCELREGSITTSAWDVVKTSGMQDPKFMAPLPLPSALVDLRNRFEAGIDTVFGVNESMFGQQSDRKSVV